MIGLEPKSAHNTAARRAFYLAFATTQRGAVHHVTDAGYRLGGSVNLS
jgi:hypothetical protein